MSKAKRSRQEKRRLKTVRPDLRKGEGDRQEMPPRLTDLAVAIFLSKAPVPSPPGLRVTVTPVFPAVQQTLLHFSKQFTVHLELLAEFGVQG